MNALHEIARRSVRSYEQQSHVVDGVPDGGRQCWRPGTVYTPEADPLDEPLSRILIIGLIGWESETQWLHANDVFYTQASAARACAQRDAAQRTVPQRAASAV